MYTNCQKELYDVNTVFEHSNRVIEELKDKIKFYKSIEKDLKSYNGKVLNIRIQKYFEEKYSKHKFYYSHRYDNYYLSITPNYEEQHHTRYEIHLEQSKEKITRYNHDNYIKKIEELKNKLNEYVGKLDKITECVMKYNIACQWFKQADKDLYNAIPEIYTFDSKRY